MLRHAGIIPTAMMDISDGLSSELLHISKESNVGCRVYEDRIPIDYQTAAMAEQFNMNLVTAALNGGEDYELLFTVPLTDHDKVSEMKGVKIPHAKPYGHPQNNPQINTGMCIGKNTLPPFGIT